ncbi:Aste57867_1693 [Aphanomyces stellatus]|uniref:Aste57867_1693 protein n=1 Tax=Aphanomyces stellatus TaxID=120398 RepID=A0A485K714_9STRA|nr:hypothetical protein As57867_001691 [Aphanomyces stellatus]VFT78904.1 Aste57867_1693 [Aphanomyces stellatus]
MSCWDCCIRMLKRVLPRNDIVVELAPYLNTNGGANGQYPTTANTLTGGGRGQTATNTQVSVASRYTNSQGGGNGVAVVNGNHSNHSHSSRRRERQKEQQPVDPSNATGRGKGSILNPALVASSMAYYEHSSMPVDGGAGLYHPPSPNTVGKMFPGNHKYGNNRSHHDMRHPDSAMDMDAYRPLPHTASGNAILPTDAIHDTQTPMLRAGTSLSYEDMNVDDDMLVYVYVSVAAFQRLSRQFQELMEEATALYVHMIRSRLNEYGGIELRFNEGYFIVGFQTEFNAARWCLAMQLGLMYAAWNPRFLRAPEVQEELSRDKPAPVFRGLRVRMAIHSAGSEGDSDDDEDVDSLVEYGVAAPEQNPRELVRLVGECVHGGQIALSDGVWEKLKEQLVQLGNPVVEDLGKHLVGGRALQLFQLLPKHLEDRHFLPLMSVKQLAPAMRDAPTAAGEVTMVFTFIEGARSLMLNDAHALVSRVKTICALSRRLLRVHRGYECQELQGDFMLAFFRPADAVAWCGEVQSQVYALFQEDPSGIQFRISMGIETGVPVSVSPHKSSGRADYFGNIVNQTARIAKAAHGGQIMMGGDAWASFMQDSSSYSERHLSGAIPFYFKDHGRFLFKGISTGTLLIEVVPIGLAHIAHAPVTSKPYKKSVVSDVPLPNRNRIVYVYSANEGESEVGHSIRDTEMFDGKSLYGSLSELSLHDLRSWFNEDSKLNGDLSLPPSVCEIGEPGCETMV